MSIANASLHKEHSTLLRAQEAIGDAASAIEMHKMAVATARNDNGRAIATLCQASAKMVGTISFNACILNLGQYFAAPSGSDNLKTTGSSLELKAVEQYCEAALEADPSNADTLATVRVRSVIALLG